MKNLTIAQKKLFSIGTMIKMDYLQKRLIVLRSWLSAMEYYGALKALEFAMAYHTGTRKDGITPEFAHQILIAMYLKTLSKNLLFPEETFITIFCHDVVEDYDVSLKLITEKFGKRSARSIEVISKKIGGMDKSPEYYYEEIATDAISSVSKGGDRIHNIQSMPKVFTKQKQEEYISETETLVLPMIKTAKRNFPEQEPVYENIKLVLISQIELIKLMLPGEQ
jgi:(p)ppGpp synthase/HD superfamily hydrolase